MRYVYSLLILAIFLFSMVFFLQNNEILEKTMSLEFSLFVKTWRSIPLPFYILLLIAFGAGSFVTLCFFFMERVRLGGEVKKCRSRQASLEKELNSLRNLPLEGDGYPGGSSSSSSSAASSTSSASYDSRAEEEKKDV